MGVEGYLGDNGTHIVLPAFPRGRLRHEEPVGAGTDGGHEGEPAAVAAHDLNDEAPLVGEGGVKDVVDGVADAGEGGVAANGGIGAGHVVVDGADEADDVEGAVGIDLGGRQLAGADEFLQQAGPLLAEDVGAGEGAIAAADDEGVDAPQDHVLGGAQAAGAFAEGHGASGPDEGTAAGEPAADVLPV